MYAVRPVKRQCTAAVAADADADTAAILFEDSAEPVQEPATSVSNADRQPPARYIPGTLRKHCLCCKTCLGIQQINSL